MTMRVLWISMTPGLYYDASGYNGGGWIASLQKIIKDVETLQLGLAFLTPRRQNKKNENNATYYPIYNKPLSSLDKIRKYYGRYKNEDGHRFDKDVQLVINDFKPDLIHLFGLENDMAASVLCQTAIPVVVHLQGLLAPIDNAFYPVGFNRSSFMWPPSKQEWLMRNGYIYAKNSMWVRGKMEKLLFKNVRYCMGRTDWDYQVSRLMAPNSTYYHVEEALREAFHKKSGTWRWHESRFVILSTVSETVYKGLDVILKTAKLLKEQTNLSFEWQVAGISANARIVSFFEKQLSIKSEDFNIKYTGIISAEELTELQSASSLYIHPSYIDNSPNSICEAQLVGMPVIATNVGGVSSILDKGKAGILVPANAPYELAFWIKKLSEDKELCRKIASDAHQIALKRHAPWHIQEQLINAYKNIIDNEHH